MYVLTLLLRMTVQIRAGDAGKGKFRGGEAYGLDTIRVCMSTMLSLHGVRARAREAGCGK